MELQTLLTNMHTLREERARARARERESNRSLVVVFQARFNFQFQHNGVTHDVMLSFEQCTEVLLHDSGYRQ